MILHLMNRWRFLKKVNMGLFDFLKRKEKDADQVSIDLDEAARAPRRPVGYLTHHKIDDETPDFYRAQYQLRDVKGRKILQLRFEDNTFVDVTKRNGGVDVHALEKASLNGQSYQQLARYALPDEEGIMQLPSKLVHQLAQRQYTAREKKEE